MPTYLLFGYVPLVVYLFWQSYLLAQYKKIADEQQEKIERLKPF
jgi:hypothetical protein